MMATKYVRSLEIKLPAEFSSKHFYKNEYGEKVIQLEIWKENKSSGEFIFVHYYYIKHDWLTEEGEILFDTRRKFLDPKQVFDFEDREAGIFAIDTIMDIALDKLT